MIINIKKIRIGCKRTLSSLKGGVSLVKDTKDL